MSRSRDLRSSVRLTHATHRPDRRQRPLSAALRAHRARRGGGGGGGGARGRDAAGAERGGRRASPGSRSASSAASSRTFQDAGIAAPSWPAASARRRCSSTSLPTSAPCASSPAWHPGRRHAAARRRRRAGEARASQSSSRRSSWPRSCTPLGPLTTRAARRGAVARHPLRPRGGQGDRPLGHRPDRRGEVAHGARRRGDRGHRRDASPRRGRRGGAVVVKVSKPQQDLRFDVPAVGPETVARVPRGRRSPCWRSRPARRCCSTATSCSRAADDAGLAIVGGAHRMAGA